MRILTRTLLAAVSVLLVPALLSAMTLEAKVREHTFANGLKLLVVERPLAPTLAAHLTIGVGSVHETSQTRGVAHLLEHMLFKGTKTLGTRDYAAEKPLLERIEAVGSRLDALRPDPQADPAEIAALEKELAELQQQHKQYVVKDEFSKIYAEHGGVGYNAFTSKDITSYIISLPANKLELWAAVESDRMQNPVLREFYTEREVIREERRRSYESNPRGMLYENLIANAFTVHPYRNPIIGWDSDIRNLTLAETRRFLERYYAPVNAVITLVGDVTFERAVEVVGRYFGDIPPGTPVPPVSVVEPPQKGEKRIDIRFDAQPSLAMAFHKPTLPAHDDYVFDVISMLLTDGPTSRLHRSLVVDRQLALSVSSYGAPGARYDNLFVISAVPRAPHTVAELEAAIEAELQRLATEPVDSADLERVRKRVRTDNLRSLRSNSGLARMLSYYQAVTGDWRYLIGYEKQIESVTADDIMAAAQRYLQAKNRTVAVIGNGGAS